VTCDCHSYNRQTGTTPERVVQHPSDPDRTVCLDACIADAVTTLWANDVDTRGSCCGHGRGPASIVLASALDAAAARDVLTAEFPERRIEILAWVLANFGVTAGWSP